jgi:hypothetical protein
MHVPAGKLFRLAGASRVEGMRKEREGKGVRVRRLGGPGCSVVWARWSETKRNETKRNEAV